jgi:homoserine dehydrogenase
VKDQPGVLARVASVMAKRRVSIASVIQGPAEMPDAASLVLTTHESDERAIGAALKQLGKLSSMLDAPLLLRIGDFD